MGDSMKTLYAQPYAYGGTGFSFDDAEEFEEKAAKSPHEEFEIQFVDSYTNSGFEPALFNALRPTQGELQRWEEVRELDDFEAAAFLAYKDRGMDNDEALDKARDEPASEQTLKDLAYDYVEQGMIGNLDFYFDHESFGRDLKISGELSNHLYDDLEDAKSNEDDAEVERIEEAIEYYDNMSDREAGEYAVENFYGDEDSLPKQLLQNYVDYDKLARDLGYDFTEIEGPGGRTFVIYDHN